MNGIHVFKTTLLATLLMGVLLVLPAAAQTTMDVTFTWSAPTTGTAVDHYVVEHSVDGGNWSQIATTSTNSYTLAATVGSSHRIRVAGVDAQSRQGPFSLSSDPYTPDLGAPGQPGKPTVF